MHPQSIALLTAEGYETGALRSKSWDEFTGADAPEMDMVITVCGSAAGETCPYWPGAPLRAHWGVEDPAAAPAPDHPKAFRAAYGILNRRAGALLARPLDEMDKTALKAALDAIGHLP